MRRDSVLRVLAVVGFGLSACAPKAVPLPDGSYHLECTTSLGACANRADVICGERGYHVLQGTERSAVFGAPDGEQVAVPRSELRFRCGPAEQAAPAPPPIASREPSPSKPLRKPARKPKPPREARPEPKLVCTPGSTQTCVGAGACTGGQACLPDGSGFGACDCGMTAGSSEQDADTGADGGPSIERP